MKFLSFSILLIFFSIPSFSQIKTIEGTISNPEVKSGATISLLLERDSSVFANTISDSAGNFRFSNLPADSFIVNISAVDYQPYIAYANLVYKDDHDFGNIVLQLKGKDLSAVTVIAKVPPVTQKGDTAQYNASQFKVNPDANAEDLIKKMPGITVDKSGTVTAQGEQVRNVTVDGKKFFGDDATAALKNLPAEIIDKIQVFDKLSDQAQFTGFDDGSATKAINIVTKTANKNSQFGRIYAGYGTHDRYSAGGNISFFKGDRRISLVGLFNNINQQNFSSDDLLGLTGSSSTRGRRGGGGSAGNFLVGQQPGISITNAFGINYSDKWSKNVEVTGSYFFNQSNTDNSQVSNSQYFIENEDNQFYDELNSSGAKNFNNRADLRIEYKIDSNNSMIFSPSISFQNNDRGSNVNGVRYYTVSDIISRTLYSTNAKYSGYNSNNNLLFRHRFSKPGRTISVGLNAGFSSRNGDIYLESINEYLNSGISNDTIQQFTDQLTKGSNYSANIAYTEPLGKKSQLQINYSPSFNKNSSDQEVFQFDNSSSKYSKLDSALTNIFDNTIHSENLGVNFRSGDKDNMFSAGLTYKYSELRSDREFPSIDKLSHSYNNLLPFLMWRKKFNSKENIRIMFRGSANTPSVNQLQDVINNSNPLFLSTGNPDLNQQINRSFSVRYSFTNTAKGKSFFANVYGMQASDYIGNATYIAAGDSMIGQNVLLPRGAQLSKPVNLDGYFSLRSFLTYGVPLKFIKSNLNLNGGFSWSKIPGFVNSVNSLTNNYTYSGGAVISSNISEYIDYTFSYSANFSVVKNNIQPLLNSNYVNQSVGATLNLLSKKGWFVANDVSTQIYSGLSAGFNQTYTLWNAAAGKKFLKNQNGELKLSVFDILKQNKSITRNVNDSYIEDVQNKILTQYFLLTFTYRLKNFGKAPQTSTRKDESGRGRPGF